MKGALLQDHDILDRVTIFGSQLYGIPGERIFSRLVDTGVHEWAETAICQQFFSYGSTVFDVGANIGYYTALMHQVVGKTGQIHCFEANPTTYEMLRLSHQHNSWKNVVINPYAVSDQDRIFHIARSKGIKEIAAIAGYNLGNWSLEECNGPIEIQATTLDQYCTASGVTPNFIKIDVEGHEPQVLAGARQLIKRKRPTLMIELSKDATQPSALKDLIHGLQTAGYAVLRILKRPYPHLKPIQLEELDTMELAYAICLRTQAAQEMGYT